MSGLFRRLSSRRSEGPESNEPQTAAEPGATDAPANTPAEPEGHKSLLTDPAAPTRVLRDGEQPRGLVSGDPLQSESAPAPDAPAADPIFGAPAPTDSGTHLGPAPLVDPGPAAPIDPNAPAPLAAPVYQPPAGEPVADLPAGLDPDELAATPSTSARRGKLRRRAAFLRAARELLLRDLGGFV
jgi:hypothetical protein